MRGQFRDIVEQLQLQCDTHAQERKAAYIGAVSSRRNDVHGFDSPRLAIPDLSHRMARSPEASPPFRKKSRLPSGSDLGYRPSNCLGEGAWKRHARMTQDGRLARAHADGGVRFMS